MNNSSDAIVTGEQFENVTRLFPSHLRPLKPPSLPFATVLLGVVSCAGICANAAVLAVLVFARRYYGSSVNTFIANQSAMDLMACVCLAVGFSTSLPGAPSNYLRYGAAGNYLVCFLFRNRTLSYWCFDEMSEINKLPVSLQLKVTRCQNRRSFPWYKNIACFKKSGRSYTACVFCFRTGA